MLASDLSLPPNQIGRPRIKSLTTIRYECPLRTEISSMPMARGGGRAHALQLGAHVLLVQFLDRAPVQFQLFGDILDGARAAAPADEPRKPLGIERVVGEKRQMLAFHLARARAANPAYLELEVYPRIGAGQVAGPTRRAVVPTGVHPPTVLAKRFFERRTSGMTLASGSPKMPRMSSRG
jgi:hypothetical protein